MTDSARAAIPLVVSPLMVAGETLGGCWRARCRQTPDSVFLISEGRELTYGEVDRMVDRAVSLMGQVGLGQGDIVALQMDTGVAFVVMILACFKTDLVVMPLSPRLNMDEASFMVGQMEPSLLMLDHDDGPLVQACRSRPAEYREEDTRFEGRSCTMVIRRKSVTTSRSDGADQVSGKPGDRPAAILCTSGTTSHSKGCVLSGRNILASEIAFNKVYGIDDRDRLILASGFYHAIGFHHGIVSTMLSGGSMVLLCHYSGRDMMRLARQYGCTYTVTVPTVVYDLLDLYRTGDPLERIISGGSPLSVPLLAKARDIGLPLYNIYGLTECAPFSCTTPVYFRDHGCMTTAGFPIEETRVRLVDASGDVIAGPDHPGQILVQGPTVFQGYYRNQAETAHVLTEDGWFSTGDLGHLTKDGALVTDGRIKDLVIRAGENISASLVEKYLMGHPDIAEVAVVGLHDQRLGERIGAFVVMKDGRPPLNLEQVKEYMAAHGVIKKFWPEELVVRDSLPKTGSGKIKKYLLQ